MRASSKSLSESPVELTVLSSLVEINSADNPMAKNKLAGSSSMNMFSRRIIKIIKNIFDLINSR